MFLFNFYCSRNVGLTTELDLGSKFCLDETPLLTILSIPCQPRSLAKALLAEITPLELTCYVN